MPPQSEDENSDSNPEFKINNEYAKNYNQWRQKEELHKLKQRYGEEACNLDNLSDNSSSDTSEDDDEVEVSEKFENDFFKVLAYLKSEDPKIHDEKISFFNNTKEDLEEGKENRKKKAKKEKAVTLRDFERKIILERGGKYSDSEDESKPKEQHGNRLTYVQEQNEIKNSFKAAVEDDEEDENLLVVKEKTEEQILKEEKRKKWLKGQEVDVDPQDEVLKPIRDFWANPNLDAGEKFLRDYILDKKYQDKSSSDFDRDYDHILHDSDENLSEDEQNIERQEEFEYKYNFRFEEPDQDFIKRYPRTLENSMRKKDTRRSEKRAELKKRKDDEKLRKKEELKELKALKRKEIEEKLEKLKEITGNEDFGIKMEDLEGDFDPNEYDQKMKKMFDDDFYTVAEDDMKPQFPEIDEEINDFDNYGENFEEEGDYHDEGPNCEDENFIMDADYDPTADAKTKKVDSKKKKKGRNKNIELPKEKPKFDPEVHSSYQEYIDRYYALDYEDMIGDIPCRFKLRKSIPNNYGLTIEEILLADDKELNKWCSLKKALEFKSEETEKNEIFKFQQKAKNEALKKKILKSVYSPEEENEEQEATIPTEQSKKKRRKKKKGKATENVSNLPEPSTSADKQNKLQTSKPVSTKSEKRKHSDVFTEKTEDNTAPKKIKQNQNKSSETPEVINNQVEKVVPSKKKKKAAQQEISYDSKSETIVESESKEIVNNTQVQNKKKKMKNKNKTLNSSVQSGVSEADSNETAKQTENVKKKKKEKNQNNISVSEVKEEITDNNNEDNKSEKYKKIMRKKENRKRKLEKKQKYLKLKNKLQKKESIENPLNELSADRLRAFGTNPKKFKNRLKYGNKNTIS